MQEIINQIQPMLEYLFEHGSYPIVFGVLVLCGVGLPIPEELTFLVAGYVTHKADENVNIMILAAMLGILAGDSLTYWLGRHYGLALMRRWPFNKLIGERGIEKAQGFFKRHGKKTVFIAGFLAGVRAPTFFLSGSMGIRYRRFILLDFARAIITCPISIWLGWKYGHEAEAVLGENKHFLWIFLGVIAAGVIVYEIIVLKNRGAAKPKPQEPAKTSSGKPGEQPGSGGV